MLKRSLPGATIFSLDKQAVLEKVRAAAIRLGQADPEIDEIRLFGSLARGDATPGSDADVLVLLAASSLTFMDRIPRYMLRGAGIGVDVFPYTRAEFERLAEHSPRFHRALTAEAVTLYRRGAQPASPDT